MTLSIYVLSLLFIIIDTLKKGCRGIDQIELIILLPCSISGVQAILAHLFITAAILQSAFIVFQFDDYCIYSPHPKDVDIIYRMKNTGILYFSLGFLFVPVYVLSVIANSYHGITMYKACKGEEKDSACKRFLYIFLSTIIELIISIELFIEFTYFEDLKNEFDHEINHQMNILIWISIAVHFTISYSLLITHLVYLTSCICCDGCKRANINNEINNQIYMERNVEEDNSAISSSVSFVERVDVLPSDTKFVPILHKRLTKSERKKTIIEGTRDGCGRELGGECIMFCTICLGDMHSTHDLLKITACNHIFHRKCITQWGQKQLVCPMCSKDIS